MMSSEQGLKLLVLMNMRLPPGVLFTLSQGLRTNQIGCLYLCNVVIPDFFHNVVIPDMFRLVVPDDESMIDNEQNSERRDDETVYFIEELRQNKSLKELCLHGSIPSAGILSNLILALVGHPKLERLVLYRNDEFDQSTRALCSLLNLGRSMLSKLTFVGLGSRSSPPRKINIGPLAEAIVRYGCLQYLDLSNNWLDILDLATLLDADSR